MKHQKSHHSSDPSLNSRTQVVALFRSTNSARSKASNELVDAEFGKVVLKRNANAKYVRLRMQADGQLVVTLPRFASERHAQDLVEQSRPAIRSWRAKHIRNTALHEDGERIGQSHSLKFIQTNRQTTVAKLTNLTLEVELAYGANPHDHDVQQLLQPLIMKALQKEARAYLPRRLSYLAEQYGYEYVNVRYGTQKGRWGSCSNKGTISLNVGLMALAPELIDYVLTHELCHTKHMNHSSNFWAAVETCLPNYKTLRKRLKTEQPAVSV